MRAEELLVIMRRIVRDFSPLLPGMRLEVVSGEAFRARLLGKPILPGEVAREEVGGAAAGTGTRFSMERRTGVRHMGREIKAPVEGDAREGADVRSRGEELPLYPLHAFPSARVIMVDIEGVRGIVGGEDRRLQRVMVEGMILREVIYLATSRQPLPDPRGRAEMIFRRHWPFQFTALRSAGFVGETLGRPREWREMAGEN